MVCIDCKTPQDCLAGTDCIRLAMAESLCEDFRRFVDRQSRHTYKGYCVSRRHIEMALLYYLLAAEALEREHMPDNEDERHNPSDPDSLEIAVPNPATVGH